MVRLYQKSWFVRQKVLGANIHETEGLLERNIAISLVENQDWRYFVPVGHNLRFSVCCVNFNRIFMLFLCWKSQSWYAFSVLEVTKFPPPPFGVGNFFGFRDKNHVVKTFIPPGINSPLLLPSRQTKSYVARHSTSVALVVRCNGCKTTFGAHLVHSIQFLSEQKKSILVLIWHVQRIDSHTLNPSELLRGQPILDHGATIDRVVVGNLHGVYRNLHGVYQERVPILWLIGVAFICSQKRVL